MLPVSETFSFYLLLINFYLSKKYMLELFCPEVLLIN